MELKKKTWTIQQLLKKMQQEKLNMNLTIHRQDGIWEKEKASNFIHSILMGYPTASFVIAQQKNQEVVVSGKQRIEAIFRFYHSYLLLHDKTPKVQETDVQTMVFKDLPPELQHQFLNYPLDVTVMVQPTEEEIKTIFYRLNDGVPLKTIEKNRAVINKEVLRYIEEVSNLSFFQEKCYLPKESKRRYNDQELIMQILLLLHNRNSGFSSREMDAFSQKLKNSSLQKDLQEKVTQVIRYLDEAFDAPNVYLRKVHLPILFTLVVELIEQNELHYVSPTDFALWVNDFFSHVPVEYQEASGAGSSKRENVQARQKILRLNFVVYKSKCKRRATLQSKKEESLKQAQKTKVSKPKKETKSVKNSTPPKEKPTNKKTTDTKQPVNSTVDSTKEKKPSKKTKKIS